MSIITINDYNKNSMVDLITRRWGSAEMVTRGRVHNIAELPGFLYMEKNEILGIITYEILNNQCEIVSLDSFEENRGIGSALMMQTIETASTQGCKRVWLVTTNDNTKAIKYYQKRWFDMKALYHNSVTKSRQLKPQIPLYGNDGIPILHELEFEMVLNAK